MRELIDIGERARIAYITGGSSAFGDRSDKLIDIDGESILKDHSVRINGNEPRCPTGAVVFHCRGMNAERRTVLMTKGNPEAVAPLVQG